MGALTRLAQADLCRWEKRWVRRKLREWQWVWVDGCKSFMVIGLE